MEYSVIAIESYTDLDRNVVYSDVASKITTVAYRIPYLCGINGKCIRLIIFLNTSFFKFDILNCFSLFTILRLSSTRTM